MNQYLGKGVSHIFGSEGYNYSKVVFSKGRPVLDSELNLMQELQEQLARRATSEMPSGWISFREAAVGRSSNLTDAFLTQSPSGAIPEIALVNGWPLLVSGTGTDINFLNKIDLSGVPLTKGSRVDGVFLETWRSVVSEEFKDITQPADSIVNTSIYSVFALTDNIGWAVGANGSILNTTNGGTSWVSKSSPTSYDLNSITFSSNLQGYAVGNNGTLLKTDNGGASWYKLALPTTNDLLCVTTVAPSFVCLVGKNGTIFWSIDGMNFVSPSSSKTSSDLKSVYFYDKVIGWAVGANGTLLRTQDGGVTWNKVNITVPDTNGVELTVTGDLNDVKFSNLNDGWIVGNSGLILKTNDGGMRWANISSNVYDSTTGKYSSIPNDLYSLTYRKSLPLQINLALYNSSTFSTATYQLTPTTISLFYTMTSSGIEYRVDLPLALYATSTDLVNAINAIVSTVGGLRVFLATLSYSDSAYESHLNQETLHGSDSVNMQFSLGDKAWISGSVGTLLGTSNSGAQWIPEDLGIAFDMYDTSFSSFSLGWAVGANAAVSRYDSSSLDKWTVQSTDLHVTPKSRVYFEGNHSAATSLNMNFDSIAPDVQVTTADRVQIQYNIRISEGVDIGNYQEAGLGSPYVYSQGPNGNVRAAGSYAFENMGPINGDYGLWRARCKNTVDGYSYAIPMFLVSKRNSAPYNPNSNINGSTNAALYVVRPDGIQPGEIVKEDIVDIRKTVSAVDIQALMQGTVDKLLENKILTKMSRDPELGTQVGSSIIHKDTFVAEEDLTTLLAGNLNSAAIGGLTGFAGPQDGSGIVADPAGSRPTQDDLTFPVFQNSIWHPQPEVYSAKYSGSGLTGVDGKDIPGGFTGMGSSVVKFVLGSTGVLNGASTPGLTYVIGGQRVDYSRPGLSSPVDIPLSVRNPDSQSTTKTAYYRSAQSGSAAQDLYETPSVVPGFTDYAEVVPQLNGVGVQVPSLVQVHRYIQPSTSTNVLRIPKDFNGFSCYTVNYINAVGGAVYRIKEIRDREIPAGQTTADSSNLIIYLDDSYRVAAGTVVHIALGVNEVPAAGSPVTPAMIGMNGTDRGETLDSFRNPYVALCTDRIKGVDGFYRSTLIYASTTRGSASVTLSTGDGSLIIGLPSMPMAGNLNASYVWYTTVADFSLFTDPSSDVWWKTIPIQSSVTGFGTDTITISLQSAEVSTTGSILVPALVKDTKLVNNNQTSYAEVLYRSIVPQTLDNLPTTLSLDVLTVSPSMFISNLGFGGGQTGMPYAVTLPQVPINDGTVGTESFYHNIFGLNTTSVSETGGFLTLPMHVQRAVGSGITLSNPLSDSFGRSFYTVSDVQLLYKAAGMTVPQPRKLFVPMIGMVTSSISSPVLRGEYVLILVSQSRNMQLDNTLSVGPNGGDACVSIYRIPGMPLSRG